ncbi:MAG: electron transfer flavoprotein subunit alpha/FixB family protein [Anaerolineales bacterium]|nr:electron transfer flavoprotein subunit alpha/FixB family protein [Anaerolineales bacterium]
MTSKLLVYMDHHDGMITPASREALGAAQQLASAIGAHVEAIVLGMDAGLAAEEAAHSGAAQVFQVEAPALSDFRAEVYAGVVASQAAGAEAVLFPDNGRTRELAAILAVDLEAGLIPDVIALEVREGAIVAKRSIYSGKVHTAICSTGRKPVILTLRSRAFPAFTGEGASGKIEKIAVSPIPALSEVVSYQTSQEAVSLADAGIIVAGGRGLSNNPALEAPSDLSDPVAIEKWKAIEGFQQLQELASVMGAAVGATRAVVDSGFVDYDHQIGQTGKVVSPDLYLAFGISGAIQHLAGIRSARTIIAVNKDAEAPIFKTARFGIVGDMHKVIPALIDAFKEMAVQ